MKHLRKPFLFCFLLAISYLAGLLLLTNGPLRNRATNVKNLTGSWGHSLERFREAKLVDSTDILFAGSSHAYRGFDPRIFRAHGYASFNLGSSAQTPLNTYYLLREHLKTIHPRLIVMDVYWTLFNGSEHVEATIDILCNSPYNSSYLGMALKSRNILVYNSVLANFMNKAFRPLPQCRQQADPYNTYIPGGFVETSYHADMDSVKRSLRPHHTILEPLQTMHFRKTLELIRERGIPLLVLITPVLPEQKEANLDYAMFTALMKATCSQYSVPFIDYNEPLNYKRLSLDASRDFYDKDHLSQSGVVKFNRVLIEDLEDFL
jgi:hypothetical protein